MNKTASDSLLCEQAVKNLGKRIRGYSLKEIKTTFEFDPQGNKKLKNEIITRKQIAPDLATISFVLSCLDPKRWTKISAEQDDLSDGTDESPDLAKLSESALREIAGLYEK